MFSQLVHQRKLPVVLTEYFINSFYLSFWCWCEIAIMANSKLFPIPKAQTWQSEAGVAFNLL